MNEIIKTNQMRGGICLILAVITLCVGPPVSPWDLLDVGIGIVGGFFALMAGVFSGIAVTLMKMNGEG